MPETDELVVNIFPLLRRQWVCGVVRSGYHNGAHCDPEDPHGGDWGCSWRFEMSVMDTPKNRRLLGITEKQASFL